MKGKAGPIILGFISLSLVVITGSFHGIHAQTLVDLTGAYALDEPKTVTVLAVTLDSIKINQVGTTLTVSFTGDAKEVLGDIPCTWFEKGNQWFCQEFILPEEIGGSFGFYIDAWEVSAGTIRCRFQTTPRPPNFMQTTGFTASGEPLGTTTAAETAVGPSSTTMGTGTVATGENSTAMGDSTAATGLSATAMGRLTTAGGLASVAMGDSAMAIGDNSTAMGKHSTADGPSSMAMGLRSKAFGKSSTAMGESTTASGDNSTAMGESTTASGDHSTAMGGETKALRPYSTAMGHLSTAGGTYSTAMGLGTHASGDNSTALGDSTVAEGEASFAAGKGARASGLGSTALGGSRRAGGDYSTATGLRTIADGLRSTAMGYVTRASGEHSTAMGYATTADGATSTAMGWRTWASGPYSTAMGLRASTNGFQGSFVYGDFSTRDTVYVAGSNQFVVRAQKFWFGRDSNTQYTSGRFIETSTGAFLSDGGMWENNSDLAEKHLFEDLDAEQVLRGMAGLPIREWSYREEDSSVRHIGPVAQDFHAAFGLGHDDKHIGTVDADGVNMLAIQALEKRTRNLQAENETLKERIAALEAAILRLERRSP